MPGNVDNSSKTIRVKLIKQRGCGLGFLVKQRTLKPNIVVAELVEGGMAEESGLIQIGDIILRINDIDVSEMSYENAVEILKAVPTDSPVVLLLRGPDEYTTHLETTFQENGMPKTIRVTKPLDNSIVGKIRRTISGSYSPLTSPARTLKNFCLSDDTTYKSGKRDSKTRRETQSNSFTEHDVIEVDSRQRDAITQTAENQCAMNGEAVKPRPAAIMDETVLDKGSLGSPKIILTSPKLQMNGPRRKVLISEEVPSNNMSPGRKSIEIFQDSDEITVVLKGDVRIKNENGEPLSPSKVVQGSPFRQNQSENRKNSLSDKTDEVQNGHLSDSESKKTANDFKKSPSAGRRLSDRRTSTASPKKYTKLRNLIDEKTTVDLLHQKSHEVTLKLCFRRNCVLSIIFVNPHGNKPKP